jgi:hypothetical protein
MQAPSARTKSRLSISLCALAQYSFGLNRQPKRHLGGAVENFEQVIAGETTELASGPVLGDEFDTPIAGATFGTGEIGFFHVGYLTNQSS